jgi:lincosamide nucleotidyltransferase B/F
MQKKQHLLERLDAIGTVLKDSGTALALLGLGSVGLETERLDDYSDLDFFVIVKPGWKTRYIASLDWLSTLCSLAYVFRNTVDGYKVLFEDGIFCEFAVFEAHELSHIPFARGRLIWQDDSFDEKLCTPPPKQQRAHLIEGTNEWHLGEALTNLYVGLGRVQRGEKLTGTRFIQSYAVDHVLALAKVLETAQGHAEDPFNHERRYEVRYPQTAKSLPAFIQGYEHNVESALALLTFLEQHFEVSPAMSAAIRELCARR